MTQSIAQATPFHREIAYDHEVHDYALYLGGELVGFARTYADAEAALDAHAQRVAELEWQCTDCPESDPAQRDPARPTHCLSCPTREYRITETTYGGAPAYIVQSALDGRPHERWLRRNPAAVVARLEAAGYVLASGPWDELPDDFPGGDDPDDGPYERHPAAAAPQGAPPSPAGPGALAPVVAGAAAEGSPRATYLARAAQARATWTSSTAPLRWGVRVGTRTVAYRRDPDAAEMMAKRLREVA